MASKSHGTSECMSKEYYSVDIHLLSHRKKEWTRDHAEQVGETKKHYYIGSYHVSQKTAFASCVEDNVEEMVGQSTVPASKHQKCIKR